MASNGKETKGCDGNDDTKSPSFNWTEPTALTLMKVLKEFHQKSGYSQQYDWAVVNKEFNAKTGIDLTKFGKYVARNKVEHMKKLWKIWCELRFKVTGAGWDKATGMVTMEDECWDSFKKTKQKGYLHFRTKGVDPELCELWDDVFGNTTATGKHVISPSMLKTAPKRTLPAPVALGDDELDGYHPTQATQATELDAYLDREFMDDPESMNALVSMVRTEGDYEDCLDSIHESLTTPLPESNTTAKGKGKGKKKAYSFEVDVAAREARKRRRKSASQSFNEHMNMVGETGKKMLSLLEGENHSTVNMVPTDIFDFGTAFAVVQRMVEDKVIVEGSKLWCFSITKLCDEVARTAFMKLDKDSSRVTWLQYEYDTTHKIYQP